MKDTQNSIKLAVDSSRVGRWSASIRWSLQKQKRQKPNTSPAVFERPVALAKNPSTENWSYVFLNLPVTLRCQEARLLALICGCHISTVNRMVLVLT